MVDFWQEKVLVSIAEKNGSDISFQAYLEELSTMGFGNRPMDLIPLLNQGYLMKFGPEEKTEITMKGRFVGAHGASVNKLFFGEVTYTSGGYYMITSETYTRKLYRVVILYTTKTDMTSATDEVPAGYEGERYVFANGVLTANNLSFSDREFTCEFTFEFAPRDRDGSPNFMIQDNIGTGAKLPALNSYTDSTKW